MNKKDPVKQLNFSHDIQKMLRSETCCCYLVNTYVPSHNEVKVCLKLNFKNLCHYDFTGFFKLYTMYSSVPNNQLSLIRVQQGKKNQKNVNIQGIFSNKQ